LIEDAYICGIDKIATIVSCGSNAPGTILSLCSKEFLKIYKQADIILSKGQGNFEALSEEKRPIFFMLMAKCPVVAKDIGCSVGEIVLLFNLKRS
jgi:damage-control phosphatase, subfamily I